jgi:phage shock protein A
VRPQAGAQKSNAPAAQSPADPLANFLGDLHALRAEILVRDDQVQRWTAMQDALRAYVELEQESDRQTRNAAIDPLQRLRNLADDTRARADAMQEASASVTDMAAALDDHQRQVFGTRLAEALAEGMPRAP